MSENRLLENCTKYKHGSTISIFTSCNFHLVLKQAEERMLYLGLSLNPLSPEEFSCFVSLSS